MEILLGFWSAVTAPAYSPFLGALIAAIVILIVELAISTLVGAGFSDMLDALIDGSSLPDSSFTNWFLIKEMPLLMALVTLLCGFGVGGLLVQGVAQTFLGGPVSMIVAIALATSLAFMLLRLVGRSLSSLKFVHSSALQPQEFIGQQVQLSSTEAYRGYAGQAQFTDRFGRRHFVMVEPDDEADRFAAGNHLVLCERVSASLFKARRAT